MDTYVHVQSPDSSASLSTGRISSNLNYSVGSALSQWQNMAAQNMVTVGGSGRPGRQFRNTVKNEDAGRAQNFRHSPAPGHSKNIPAEEGAGNPGESLSGPPSQEHRSQHILHQNGHVSSESSMSLWGVQGALGARTARHAPPHAYNAKDKSPGDLLDPSGVNGIRREGYSAPGEPWNPCGANENVLAARDFCHAPPNIYDAGGENHLPAQRVLAIQNSNDSHGSIPGAREFPSNQEDSLLARDPYNDPASIYNVEQQRQNPHNSNKTILATQRHLDIVPNACDADGSSYLPQGSLSAEDHNYGQKNTLAPRDLFDAYRNISMPRNSCRNAPPDICDEPSRLFIKASSPDQLDRYIAPLHNSPTILALSPPATDRHLLNNFSTSTPSISSPVTSVFGGNAPSIGSIPYVSITNLSTTHLLRNNANNNAASSQRLDSHTDPSPSISTASSSSNTSIATMFPPGGIVISDAEMKLAMAYCYDRGNGQFTRLVPVDVLPFSLRDLPARVFSDEGMIVLPVPRMIGPDGQPANVQLIPHVAGNNVTVSSATLPTTPLSDTCHFWLDSLGFFEDLIWGPSSGGRYGGRSSVRKILSVAQRFQLWQVL